MYTNHNMDACREDLPKVSIETEQDWKRIQNNLSEALSARLDKELESRGNPGDKEAILPHIDQFLETLFDIARPNLRINGRTTDSEPTQDDDVEPFDEALDRYIWSLSDQRLKWDKDVAARRRTRPKEIERLISDTLAQHNSVELDVAQEDPAYDVPDKPFDPEPQEVFSSAASLTAQLSQSISLQHERAIRAKSVFQEIKVLKS